MTSIVIDGLNEEDFRRSVQNRLREGRVSPAIARLRALLTPYAQPGGLLPERFLTVQPGDMSFAGWDSLGDAVARHDRPGRPVTALSIAFGWPGEDEPQVGSDGRLQPCIETAYYNDDAFPFSQSSRDDMLEGYSSEGCTWGGDCEAADSALALNGVSDLYGALASLESDLLAMDDPDEAGLTAGSLAACLLSALLVEAVKAQIEAHGLPRPLCVTAGSSGVYPYFDVPVAGMPAAVLKKNEAEEDMVPADQGVPVPRYSSLLLTGIPRAQKRAVLTLEAAPEDTAALRIASLRQLAQPPAPPAPPAQVPQPAEIETRAPLPEAAPEDEPAPYVGGDAGGLLLAKKPAKTDDLQSRLAPREDDLQQRLQSLIALHAPRQVASDPVPKPSIDWEFDIEPAQAEAPVAEEAAADLAAEPEWEEPALEPAHEPVGYFAEEPAEAPRRTLWSRIRDWFHGT